MKYNPAVHHRRSIRLQGYDYSHAGAYFVTICTQKRDCLFGDIVDEKMRLNDAGEMVGRWYSELENKFSDIECDEFVCMPNHIHFIAVNVAANVGADLCVRPGSACGRPDSACVRPDSMNIHPVDSAGNVRHDSPRGPTRGATHGQTHRSAPTTAMATITAMGEQAGSPLHRVVQWFKTMTTNRYIRGVKQNGWSPFPGKLWQRNYWEHIVRNESELIRIREYIRNNPAQWELDTLNDRRGGPMCPPSSDACPPRFDACPSTGIRESSAKYVAEVWMV